MSSDIKHKNCNLNGVQVVAGSNPATPTFEANPCQNGIKKLLGKLAKKCRILLRLSSWWEAFLDPEMVKSGNAAILLTCPVTAEAMPLFYHLGW